MPVARDRCGKVQRDTDEETFRWHFVEEPHCYIAENSDFVETETVSYTVVGTKTTRHIKRQEAERKNLCSRCLVARDLWQNPEVG